MNEEKIKRPDDLPVLQYDEEPEGVNHMRNAEPIYGSFLSTTIDESLMRAEFELLKSENRQLRGLVDGAYEIVAMYGYKFRHEQNGNCEKWAQDWMAMARKFGAGFDEKGRK